MMPVGTGRRGKKDRARQLASTYPQIFIAGTYVGGCDDLYALDEAGKLDPLLAKVKDQAKEAPA